MIQCPACSSFNDADAAFCSQCGRPLGRRSRRLPGRSRGLLLVAAGLLLGTAGVWVADRLLRTGAPAQRPHAARRARPEGPAEAPRKGAAAPEDAGEPGPPAPAELRRLFEAAQAVVALFDARDRELRSVPGVLVGETGAVLMRFRPLLGAYRGLLLSSSGGAGRREVLGIAAYDPFRDLALLEVRDGAALGGLTPAEAGEGALAAGTEVLIVAPGRTTVASVAEFPVTLGDGVRRARLAVDPPLAAGSLFAADLQGGILGLLRREPGAPGDEMADAPRLYLDPLGPLADAVVGPASLTLADATRRFHEGTFVHLLDEAREAVESENLALAVDLLQKALDQAEHEGTAEVEVQKALDLLRRAADAELARLARERDFRGAASLLLIAAARFPLERRYWLDLGAVRLELSEPHEAIAALLEARRLEPGTDLDTLLQRTYLEASAREVAVGRVQLGAEWLESGLEVLPGSARIHLELAKLYGRLGFYDDAVRVYSAAKAFDPGLAPEVDAAVERIGDLLRRREAVVIEIPQGSTTIQAEVVLNGVGSYRFIIDTGATFTSISQEMADQLGYQVGPTSERVVISTANGIITAPLVLLGSVNLQGFVVRNVKAVVLPARAQGQVGLLGLNFLDHFRYSVDAGRREFKLERR